MIRVEKLCKRYSGADVLHNVSFEVTEGEVVSVIGASGCGKSSLLRCIIGLEPITGGRIFVDDRDVSRAESEQLLAKKKIGMVFQQFNLFSHLLIVENVMLGPVNILRLDRQEAYDKSVRLLESVGLAGCVFKYPHELSGGQQQRAAIARCLAMDPEIILFDEPTSALDPTMVGEVLAVIKKLADEGHTMMIATHEMDFARKVSTRILYLDEKGIYEDGPPSQIFLDPQRPKTRDFIYRIKDFDYVIDGSRFDLYDFQSRVEAFLHKQMFTEKRIRIHQLVSEEIIFYMILPIAESKQQVRISYSLSYSAELDSAEITFESELIGEDFLNYCNDDLSMMIVRKYSNDFVIKKHRLTVHMKSTKELKLNSANKQTK